MSKNVTIIGIAIVLIGVIVAFYFYNLGHKDLTNVKADYKLSASELYSEFSENEESANEKYVDKVIEVNGLLAGKEVTPDSTLNLVLKTSEPMGSVICNFNEMEDPGLKELKPGDDIIVRGVCKGMLMDVLLNNCVIVDE